MYFSGTENLGIMTMAMQYRTPGGRVKSQIQALIQAWVIQRKAASKTKQCRHNAGKKATGHA